MVATNGRPVTVFGGPAFSAVELGLKAKKMTAKAENSGKQSRVKEDERLRELAVSSATLCEIAEKLNRTESAT
jgi:hypothetical protein